MIKAATGLLSCAAVALCTLAFPRAAGPPFVDIIWMSITNMIGPGQYMDKWRLSRNRVMAQPNAAVKQALGFAK